MAATIRQIAEHTRLSLQTVSQILNDKGAAYRPETRERVLQSAQELGYRPNSSARAMRNGQFSCVALLLSTIQVNSLLPPSLLDGIQDGCAEANVTLSIARLPDEKLVSPDVLPKILREWGSDGLLINYNSEIPSAMIELIERYRLPVVWLNSKQAHDCVFPDDFEGAYRGTESLIALGHRRIAYGDWIPVGHYSSLDRLAGYTQAMQKAGLIPVRLSEPLDLSSPQTIRETGHWLLEDNRPTAVICYNNGVALPLFCAASTLGLVVPNDLSLLTINDELYNSLRYGLDTLLLPGREMGKTAVELLMQKITAPNVTLPPCAMPLSLHRFGSCAPPERS